jgi:hypothetical protein
MPGATEIPNYKPDDTAWGVVIGPFIRPAPSRRSRRIRRNRLIRRTYVAALVGRCPPVGRAAASGGAPPPLEIRLTMGLSVPGSP